MPGNPAATSMGMKEAAHNTAYTMQGLVIYKSSAGSGKTYTLVLEYLKIVIRDPSQYRHILAVTFTNKATDEMKDRIIRALSQLANLAPGREAEHPVWRELDAYLRAAEPEKQWNVPRQAQKVLSNILNDYSNFSVSTIESFFQRIVRAFARELNIPIGYDVVMDQELILRQVSDELMMDIGKDQNLTRLLLLFLERNLEEENTWHVDEQIRRLGTQVFKEKFQRLLVQHPESPDQLQAVLDLEKRLWAIVRGFESRMEALADEALTLIDRAGLRPDGLKFGKTGPAMYFVKVKEKKEYEAGSRVGNAAQNPEDWYNKTGPERGQIAPIAPELSRIAAALLDLYDKRSDYETARIVQRNLLSFALLSDLRIKLEEYRRDNSRMIISDTGFLLNQIVSAQYDTPFIFEKTGTRYHYYLLDEFQDTSDMQWENLLPLVREALAQGNGGLVVGDVKQSIYRWRNGNMFLLMSQVEAEVREQGLIPEVKPLNSNWRTAADIVHFNNSFFERAIGVLEADLGPAAGRILGRAYEGVAQVPERKAYPGFVSFAFFEKSNNPEAGDWEQSALEHTLEVLNQVKADGFEAWEITLLVRTNRDGTQVANFLQQQGVRVVSAESLLIVSDPGVRLLEALLHYLDDPETALTRATLAYYHQRVTMGVAAGDMNFPQLETLLPEDLIAKQEQLSQMPVYECLERLIRLYPHLAEPNAYIQGFRDAVLQYSGENDGGLPGFLEWWDEQRHKRAIAVAPDRDAVQIMTIHKSKGLEFPVVILPLCDWQMGPKINDILWVEPEGEPFEQFPFLPVRVNKALESTRFQDDYARELLESYLDNLNLLYVAFTRPEYRLYACCPRGSKEPTAPDRVGSLIRMLLSEARGHEAMGDLYTEGQAVSRAEIRRLRGESGKEAGEGVPLKRNEDPMGDWSQSIRIKLDGLRMAGDLLERNRRQDFGELLHEALGLIKVREDLPAALERLRLQGLVSAQEMEGFAQRMGELLSVEEVKGWFSGDWEVKNEAEILLANGAVLRPDRVMIRGEELVVVDYKSGAPNDKHRTQVLRYLDALKDMGYAGPQGYLYYLKSGKVEALA
ncbi:MAG: Dna2/Cas4 domain-containing protein [Bacteroidetes bacterium]|nr:MAG: Dna2/Cas4 domain-containing protein [Bacteroidota bacterium]